MSYLQHRSIRRYKDTPVPERLLERIIEAGVRASNTGNMQTYCVVSTTDAARKQAMAPLHFNQPLVSQAPLLLTVCIDFNRFEAWCHARQAKPGYCNLLGFTTALVDASLFAQNMCTAAEDNGLGICYLGTTMYNLAGFIELLELPRGVIPIVTIAVGYPDESPALTPRLPLEAVWHRETYHAATPADIDCMYSDFERIPQHQQFVADNQLETLAQVFTNVRYKPDVYASISKAMADALRAQGFTLGSEC